MMPLIHTYEQAIEFLFGRINYERIQAEAYSTSDFKLDRMRRLLELMGNPHLRIPAIHVAGTKGKGSTCSMVSTTMAAAGYRCGLYISPHITVFEERISINGVTPSADELVDLVNQLMPLIQQMDELPGRMQPTYFELATALAWQHFINGKVDVAVLEVGLGGRLDSTNLCHPVVTAITNVSRDHTHVLGSTVRQIAYEKAGIIKAGIPVISGVTHVDAVVMVEETCRQRQAPLYLLNRDFQIDQRRVDQYGEVEIDVTTMSSRFQNVPVKLRGPHQSTNTAIALAIVDSMRSQQWKITDQAVRMGLTSVNWPGRVEIIAERPKVIIDAAHNWESARALMATLEEIGSVRKTVLVFAATKDKDVAGILRLLLPDFQTIILTRYVENPRGVPLDELSSLVHSMTSRPFHLAANPDMAWQLARKLASPEDLIVITGSFFLVAELRSKIAGVKQ